ncbi:MAG: 4Fe-4S binding protein [Oscillospiraceae bacterium]|nr:4Fe-4S binding protein [Oscillospiraceae bacterium]
MAAKFNEDECIRCGACVDDCPFEALSLPDDSPTPVCDEDLCFTCGSCLEICPMGAITIEE